MPITFTHAYRPYWLANAIKRCTEQTHKCVCVMQPFAVTKQRDVPSFCKPKCLQNVCNLHVSWEGSIISNEQNCLLLPNWEVNRNYRCMGTSDNLCEACPRPQNGVQCRSTLSSLCWSGKILAAVPVPGSSSAYRWHPIKEVCEK